jgi:hypothetical protein
MNNGQPADVHTEINPHEAKGQMQGKAPAGEAVARETVLYASRKGDSPPRVNDRPVAAASSGSLLIRGTSTL